VQDINEISKPFISDVGDARKHVLGKSKNIIMMPKFKRKQNN
jgi:hypothetical protein